MKNIYSLFLAANPLSTERLKLDEEIREITSKIRSSEYRDSIELVSMWAVRPDDLLQSLNIYKPRIVHFSGHSSSAGEIILVDRNGDARPVATNALKALFTTFKDNIQLVILNACFSRIQAEAIIQVIDCAIGMAEGISDDAAITFTSSFYRAIGFGRSVQDAFEQGKLALLLEGIPQEHEPVLLVRSGVDPSKLILTSSPSSMSTDSNDQTQTKPPKISASELSLTSKVVSTMVASLDVFLCHSSADKPVVQEIAKILRVNGITYWLDSEQINFGDRIVQAIEHGLHASRYIVPCLSHNLQRSNWTRAEYGAILNAEFSGSSDRIVIPLKLDNCTDEDIPMLLRDKKRVVYSNKAEFAEFLDFLKKPK